MIVAPPQHRPMGPDIPRSLPPTRINGPLLPRPTLTLPRPRPSGRSSLGPPEGGGAGRQLLGLGRGLGELREGQG